LLAPLRKAARGLSCGIRAALPPGSCTMVPVAPFVVCRRQRIRSFPWSRLWLR